MKVGNKNNSNSDQWLHGTNEKVNTCSRVHEKTEKNS